MSIGPRPASKEGKASSAAVSPPASDGDDALARLVAILDEVRAQHSDLLLRYLSQVERIQALDKSLYGERLRVAVLKRDVGAFERQLRTASAEREQLRHASQEAEAARQHAERKLGEARAERERLVASAHAEREQQQATNAQLQDEVAKLRDELEALRNSKVWRAGQRYWSVARRLRGQ